RLRRIGRAGPPVQRVLRGPQHRSHRRLDARRGQQAVTPHLAVIVTQLSLVFSGHRAVHGPDWHLAELGRFVRGGLALRTARLGFLHSKNGDKINSVRRPVAGLGLYDLAGPHAADRARRVIAMIPAGEIQGTRAPLDPRRYHESVTGERTEIATRPP